MPVANQAPKTVWLNLRSKACFPCHQRAPPRQIPIRTWLSDLASRPSLLPASNVRHLPVFLKRPRIVQIQTQPIYEMVYPNHPPHEVAWVLPFRVTAAVRQTSPFQN